MKKIILVASTVIVISIALFIYMFPYTSKQKTIDKASTIYKKEDLHPSTQKELGNPLYQNQITAFDLNKALAEKQPLTIYFYSPECSYCIETTPIIVPLAKDMGINIQLHNTLEFDSAWDTYDLEYIPTIIHFDNGVEIDRIVGSQEKEMFKKWLGHVHEE